MDSSKITPLGKISRITTMASQEAEISRLSKEIDDRERVDEIIRAVSGISGPQGEKGEQGPQGEQGLRGLQGPQGERGERGLQGLDGKEGKEGKRGRKGEKGSQGDPGKDGKDFNLRQMDQKDVAFLKDTLITDGVKDLEIEEEASHLVFTVLYDDGSKKVKRVSKGGDTVFVGGGSNGGGGGGVSSVNGDTGPDVVLDTSNIAENTNLYYTEDRVSANSNVAANTAKNSYPSADATKLAGIAAGAQVNTINAGDNISTLVNDAGYLTDAPTNQVMIVLGLNDSQSVDSTTDTAISFNTSDIKDTGFTHSTSNNPSRITVDAAGRYKIEAQISINGTTGNYRLTTRAAVRVNGTTTRQYIDSAYVRAATGSNESNITVLDVVELSANDYIEVMVARISSTSGNGVTTPNKTKFIMTKVG